MFVVLALSLSAQKGRAVSRLQRSNLTAVAWNDNKSFHIVSCAPGFGVGFPVCAHHSQNMQIRKILVSVQFLSAILGPEMGASILWTPGKNAFFLQEKPMSIKFLVFAGGGIWGFGGGGGVPILFLWARGFSEQNTEAITRVFVA